jgi:hypothetical protein
MAKFKGEVRRTDLEGGGWILVTEHGVVYQLKGGGPGLREGARVEIEAEVTTNQVGITMMGDVLEVRRLRVL